MVTLFIFTTFVCAVMVVFYLGRVLFGPGDIWDIVWFFVGLIFVAVNASYLIKELTG